MTKEELLKQSQEELLGKFINDTDGKKIVDHDGNLNELKKSLPQNKILLQDSKDEDIDYQPIEDDETYNEYSEVDEYNNTNEIDIPHDIVVLPSKGLVYGNGFKSRLPVSYLTASDEDILTSINLTLNNKTMDVLLKRKILDKNIKPEYLVKADRDQILIWLRATSYGLYPVTVRDPETDTTFEAEIDLNQIKPKPFKLKPNKNGFFEFKTPMSEDLIEFRFLNYKDEVEYEKMLKKTNEDVKRLTLKNSIENIIDVIKSDKDIEPKKISELEKSLKLLNDYMISIQDVNNNTYSKSITFILERSIVSINNNYNKDFIKNYISYMRANDALEFRKHISDNTPSLNYNIEIKKPESLGGGTITTFLQIGDDLFFNIS